jgi:16S rRNA (cytosine1402-N4)-methyltransferase
MQHVPVLLNEVIEVLDPKPEMFLIDGTVSLGGHLDACIAKMLPKGTVLGVDLDGEILTETKARIQKTLDSNNTFRAFFIQGNYADLPEILKRNELPKADALLLDLGFSSVHIDTFERGFSFQKDEFLDMRYDTEDDEMTAAMCINQTDAKMLATIFKEYGEERYAERIAKKIVEERRKEPITTTRALADLVCSVVPRRGKIHPATRVFQALRIYVNNELENVKKIVAELENVVAPGGRVAIISFHSLEDRLVKRAFMAMEKEGKAQRITKKPIQATRTEQLQNPRSRSAKLRGIQIL